MGKKRSTRHGKPSALARSARRRDRANSVYTQWRVVEIEMTALVKAGRMTATVQLHNNRLPLLCERLKTATESWLQALYKRIRVQHGTIDMTLIVAQWQSVTRNKHSVIYQLVSTRTAAGYYGMEESRICTERYKEHLTCIRDSDFSDDKKYRFMSRYGGPGCWIYVPLIFSSIHVEKKTLLTLELRETSFILSI